MLILRCILQKNEPLPEKNLPPPPPPPPPRPNHLKTLEHPDKKLSHPPPLSKNNLSIPLNKLNFNITDKIPTPLGKITLSETIETPPEKISTSLKNVYPLPGNSLTITETTSNTRAKS